MSRFSCPSARVCDQELLVAPEQVDWLKAALLSLIARDEAIKANANIQAELLRTSSTVIRHALKAGKVKVEAGMYDLASGKVTLS
jgi:carbonic anhydrase